MVSGESGHGQVQVWPLVETVVLVNLLMEALNRLFLPFFVRRHFAYLLESLTHRLWSEGWPDCVQQTHLLDRTDVRRY